MSISPELQAKLDAVSVQAEKVKLLNEQLSILTDEAEAARLKVRVAYRDLYLSKFKDFDYKSALVGAQVTHTVKFGSVTFKLSPPSAAKQRDLDAFAATLTATGTPVAGTPAASPDKPKIPAMVGTEGMLVLWLVAVQLENQPERRLDSQPWEARLTAIRGFTDVLIAKLANECSILESWLSAQLEIELGN